MSHLKRHVLANVGLLVAALYSGGEEVVQVRGWGGTAPAHHAPTRHASNSRPVFLWLAWLQYARDRLLAGLDGHAGHAGHRGCSHTLGLQPARLSVVGRCFTVEQDLKNTGCALRGIQHARPGGEGGARL